MMNNPGETSPFLVQFESDIVNEGVMNDGGDTTRPQSHSIALERATKVTRVRDETTDDE
jgi:hypothetical protein